MTAQLSAVRFTGREEAAAVAAFLTRLLRWDRAAAVRLQARGGLLAVFGRPAAFQVLAVRTAGLAEAAELDITVSAGELLEGVEEATAAIAVPRPVTGPPWAGLLPPHAGWRRTADLPCDRVQAAAAAVIAEFRERSEALGEQQRTREALDELAEDIWSRPLDGTGLPLRAVHAAHALGFLRPAAPPAAGAGAGAAPQPPLSLLAAGPWLRLRTPYGSVAVRSSSSPGLPVTPLR